LLPFSQLTRFVLFFIAGILPESADRLIPGTSFALSLLIMRAGVLIERALPGIDSIKEVIGRYRKTRTR